MKYKLNKKYRLINKTIDKVILDDYLVTYKQYPITTLGDEYEPLISFDSKIFFNPVSPNILIEDSDSEEIIKISNIDNLVQRPYREISDNPRSDIFIERDIFGLDPEVETLVHALNDLSGIKTTGSCCGHDITELWVSFLVSNFKDLRDFMLLLDKHAKKTFCLKTAERIMQSEEEETLHFEIRTYTKGEEAYKAAERLAKIIKLKVTA